jgi:hypothetical protein
MNKLCDSADVAAAKSQSFFQMIDATIQTLIDLMSGAQPLISVLASATIGDVVDALRENRVTAVVVPDEKNESDLHGVTAFGLHTRERYLHQAYCSTFCSKDPKWKPWTRWKKPNTNRFSRFCRTRRVCHKSLDRTRFKIASKC